jgi:CubicO group peptidase (beta-lactamase class C family)
MRIGRTLPDQRAKGEVKYYDTDKGPAVLGPQLGKLVPEPYGAWYLEAMDAHGGWIASAPDLIQFATAFDRPAQCKILQAKSIAQMFARPQGLAGYTPKGKPLEEYYGCGWSVRPTNSGSKRIIWHDGSLPGTATLLVGRDDGMTWAALFNSREGAKKGNERLDPVDQIDGPMHDAANAYLQKTK